MMISTTTIARATITDASKIPEPPVRRGVSPERRGLRCVLRAQPLTNSLATAARAVAASTLMPGTRPTSCCGRFGRDAFRSRASAAARAAAMLAIAASIRVADRLVGLGDRLLGRLGAARLGLGGKPRGFGTALVHLGAIAFFKAVGRLAGAARGFEVGGDLRVAQHRPSTGSWEASQARSRRRSRRRRSPARIAAMRRFRRSGRSAAWPTPKLMTVG